jgi:hypothetical protein
MSKERLNMLSIVRLKERQDEQGREAKEGVRWAKSVGAAERIYT